MLTDRGQCSTGHEDRIMSINAQCLRLSRGVPARDFHHFSSFTSSLISTSTLSLLITLLPLSHLLFSLAVSVVVVSFSVLCCCCRCLLVVPTTTHQPAHQGVFEGARNPAPHVAPLLGRLEPTRFSPLARVGNGTGRAPVPVAARVCAP